jgi:hypothetical protein
VTHWPFAVQHPAQFCGPQAATPSQKPPPATWPRQIWPAAHVEHCAPFAPQEVRSRPVRHWSPTQQPLQLVASHLPRPHARVTVSHARPSAWQSTHEAPFVPHAFAAVPDRQRSRPPSVEQHPLGHSAGEQLVTVRPQTLPLPHESKPMATQSAHAKPPEPHDRVSSPVRHWPAASQHPPGHVEGPHVPGGTTLASKDSGSRLERPQPGVTSTSTLKRRTKKAKTWRERRTSGMNIGRATSTGSVAEPRGPR